MIHILRNPSLGSADFVPRESILVRSIRNLIGAQEHGRSFMGHRLAGFDTEWQTSSTTYTQVNGDTTERDLSEFSPIVRPYRMDATGHLADIVSPSDALPKVGLYLVQVRAFLLNLDLRLRFYELEAGAKDAETLFGDALVLEGGTAGWYSAHILTTLESGREAFRIKVDGKRTSTVAKGNGTVVALHVWEPRLLWHTSWGFNVLDLFGDEWIGHPLTHGDALASWAPDGATRQWTQDEASVRPQFVRNGININDHSVLFDGSTFFGPTPAETTIGLLGGQAAIVLAADDVVLEGFNVSPAAALIALGGTAAAEAAPAELSGDAQLVVSGSVNANALVDLEPAALTVALTAAAAATGLGELEASGDIALTGSAAATSDEEALPIALSESANDWWLSVKNEAGNGIGELYQDTAQTSPVTANGQDVESINDLINDKQFDYSGSAPTYEAAGLNSGPCFDFTGGNESWTRASTTMGDPCTVIAVYESYTDSAGYLVSWGLGGSVRVLYATEVPLLGNDGPGFFDGAFNAWEGNSGEDHTDDPAVWAGTFDSSNDSRGYRDGVQFGSTVSSFTSFGGSSNTATIGGPSNFPNARITDILYFDRVLTGTELDDLVLFFHNRNQLITTWLERLELEGTDANLEQLIGDNGSDLVDLSSNGNDPTHSASLTHGQAALGWGADNSTEGNGSAGVDIDASSAGINITDSAWTVAGVVTADNNSDGIFALGGSGNSIVLGIDGSQDAHLYADDGSSPTDQASSVFVGGTPVGFVVKKSGATVSWWLNGTKQTDLSLSGMSFSSSTAITLMGSDGLESLGALDGKFEHRGTWSVALDDADCENYSDPDYGDAS